MTWPTLPQQPMLPMSPKQPASVGEAGCHGSPGCLAVGGRLRSSIPSPCPPGTRKICTNSSRMPMLPMWPMLPLLLMLRNHVNAADETNAA